MELTYREQDFYWQRFTAFATLHAALFVLVTATLTVSRFWSSLLISILSICLAIIWFAVQHISLKYVDRWKPAFHAERELIGIKSQIDTDYRYSSTDLAWWVPLGIFVVWLVVLGGIILSTLH